MKISIFCLCLAILLLPRFGVTAGVGKNITCQTSGCHQNLGAGSISHGPIKTAKGCKVCHPVVKTSQNADHPILEKLNPQFVNKTCYLCHEEVEHSFAGAKSVHKVLSERSCVACHEPHRADNQKLLKTANIVNLCLDCHKDFASQKAKGSHHQISKMKNGCLNCHEPHASQASEKLLKASNNKDLCLKCHEKDISSWVGLGAQKLHKPVQEGECQKCHDIHGSEAKALLPLPHGRSMYSASPVEEAKLCWKCHEDKVVNQPKALEETQFRNGSQNLHTLHVLDGKKKRNCSVCHDPHGSSQGSLIRAQFQFLNHQVPLVYQKTKTGGTCATACHKNMTYDREKAVKNVTDP
ncbi:MAG: cytochrome c [Oligoflexia bacterium]|nr:MAG: cytochrome c [Oligoflexia bacterium]